MLTCWFVGCGCCVLVEDQLSILSEKMSQSCVFRRRRRRRRLRRGRGLSRARVLSECCWFGCRCRGDGGS